MIFLERQSFASVLKNYEATINNNVDLSILQKGIYIVALEYEGKIQSKKLVIE